MSLPYGAGSRGVYGAPDKGNGPGSPDHDALRQMDELLRGVDGYGLDLEDLEGGLEGVIAAGREALASTEATGAAAEDHLRYLREQKESGHARLRSRMYAIPGGRANSGSGSQE